MKKRFSDFSNVHLYAVTPSAMAPERLLEKIRGILAGGADALQLRLKGLSDRAYIELGSRVKSLCDETGALFLINDRPDVCLALEADGVHLGQDDMPLAQARAIVGHNKIIGISAHSLSQALQAQEKGADYVSCGPIWATPTKPDYKAVGLELIRSYRGRIHIPFVVIGGVNLDNVESALNEGAPTVAVVRGLFEAKDPARAVRNFLEKFGKAPASIS